MNKTPFFSIITVVRNDAWALQKTTRSVFEQSFSDFEYIVIDGDSIDGSNEMMAFWHDFRLVTKAVSESDSGVYNAMNKGLQLAGGDFVCYMNAGDVFSDNGVLECVYDSITSTNTDGVLGWGELNGEIWASWIGSEAFKMASLGFCHQSLYVRRSLLLHNAFDERPFKTDSDTRQLASLYRDGASIAIMPSVLSVRSRAAGISADLERSGRSIIITLSEEYPTLTREDAQHILGFRRRCKNVTPILQLLDCRGSSLSLHLAFTVLDTLFLRQSRKLDRASCEILLQKALQAIDTGEDAPKIVRQFLLAQEKKRLLLEERKERKSELNKKIVGFEQNEKSRIRKLRAARKLGKKREVFPGIVSLTTFPARIKSVRFVIESLIEQSVVPKRVQLWIGRDEFPSRKWLPNQLLALERQGLEVCFVEKTCHQYDKYLHNWTLNERLPFVMVDDDVIYVENSLETLLNGHRVYPEAVIANRAHRMMFLKGGGFAPYREWEKEVNDSEPGFKLFPTGAGGVLYPPGFMANPAVTDVHSILQYAPYADDIWLKFCGMAQNIPVFATHLSEQSSWYQRYTPNTTAGTLMNSNVLRGLNDIQIDRCWHWLKSKEASKCRLDCMKEIATVQ